MTNVQCYKINYFKACKLFYVARDFFGGAEQVKCSIMYQNTSSKYWHMMEVQHLQIF